MGKLYYGTLKHTTQSQSTHFWHGHELLPTSQSRLATTKVPTPHPSHIQQLNENKNRLHHDCKVGDLVLIVQKSYQCKKKAKLSTPTEGPFTGICTYMEGNVNIQCKNFKEGISICRIHPYHPPN